MMALESPYVIAESFPQKQSLKVGKEIPFMSTTSVYDLHANFDLQGFFFPGAQRKNLDCET